MVVLAIIQDLMIKAQDLFLDHFARLGIFSKVQALTGPNDIQENIEENEASNEQGMLFIVLGYYKNDDCFQIFVHEVVESCFSII